MKRGGLISLSVLLKVKQFNYDLLENRKDQIKQDNSGKDRVYHSPNGTYPSITNLVYHMISKPGIQAWRDKIGHKEADKISGRAARKGTRVHNVIEKYLRGNENYLKDVMPDHKELILAGIPQIDERIDNIRGIELPMWSDGLKVAGTTDLVADYCGDLAIIDWKTASYVKKEEYVLPYLLQGTAYCLMLYEMYGLLPKKLVICTFIRFSDPKKPVPFMDGDKVTDLFVEWKEYNPLDYIRRLKAICDAFHHFKENE